MKKIICVLAASLILATMGTSVFAATADTSKIDSRIAAIQQRQQEIEQKTQSNQAKISDDTAKMEKANAFRQALLQDRINVLGNEDKNLQIMDQNKTLRLSMANAVKAVKESGTSLSADTIAALKADNQQISQIWAAIKATKGQIQTIDEQNKALVKSKDTAALDANFQKIYSIQNYRNQELEQINGVLEKMNALLTGSTASSGSSTSTASSSAASSY